MNLILTLITGLFFLLGVFLSKNFNKNNYSLLAISLAFGVLLNLILTDILPEVIESFSFYSILFIILGLIILKVMDLFVPHHHHTHHEHFDNKIEHEGHLEHISIITILALSLHNILECMALFNISKTDLSSGMLMCIGIGLHNIPLGFSIGTKLEKNKTIYLLILVLSGLFGGILCLLIGDLPFIIENMILCLTLGMLIYLCIFELGLEFFKNIKNRFAWYGIIISLIIILLTNLI